MAKTTLKLKSKVLETLEDLRENFDLEYFLNFYVDGRLEKWLNEKGYGEQAEKVSKLTAKEPDILKSLCSICEIEGQQENIDALNNNAKNLKKIADNCFDDNNSDEIKERIASLYLKAAELNDKEAQFDMGLYESQKALYETMNGGNR